MTRQRILTTLKNFQRLSDKSRQRFFSAFEKKMIYRTTKTENPETTLRMVKDILSKYPTKTRKNAKMKQFIEKQHLA